ncbi:hypothetical protein Tco_1572076, partial [Tanacetum coccineum]
MALCTTLQNSVLDLEKTKTTQHNEIASLKRRVKKLEKENRRIDAIETDEEITLVNVQDDVDKEMFDMDSLNEVVEVINTAKLIINVAQDSAAGDIVSTTSAVTSVSTATTTTTIITTVDDVTLAQELMEIKSTKPKEKRVVIQELGESTTTVSSQLSSQHSQHKGKGIIIEPVKKKDQIRLNEEAALNLQAKFDEEERLIREKAEKEQEANIALMEEWDDIQEKIDANHQLAERLQA